MSHIQTGSEHPLDDPDTLPFVAPCAQLAAGAPLHWLALGWRDFRNAFRASVWYGGFLVLLSYMMALVTWQLGGYWLIFGVMSGFVFIAPVLAIGLYSISCQLERGLKPQIGYCLKEGRRHLGDEMVYAVILMVVFLVWARAASMVHVFFPMEADASLVDLLVFFGIGSLVGAIFLGIVFCASAFSLPMMLDRKVDTVTAVLTSTNAVLRNKAAMLVWVSIIAVSVLIGFATLFIGLGILMPVIGYATWHGYRETIQATAWPENSKLPIAADADSLPQD